MYMYVGRYKVHTQDTIYTLHVCIYDNTCTCSDGGSECVCQQQPTEMRRNMEDQVSRMEGRVDQL